MTIRVTLSDNRVLTFEYGLHVAIDKMVAALKDNLPEWKAIEIVIKREE